MIDLDKYSRFYSIDAYSLFEISGPDSERFLNGQFTNNVASLLSGEAQFSARVNRTGHLQAYFYLLKKADTHFYILIRNSMRELLKDDLAKFLIMDDVSISSETIEFKICFKVKEINLSNFKFSMFGQPVGLSLGCAEEPLPTSVISQLSRLYGTPEHQRFKKGNFLINNYSIVDSAVSSTKGCYIGQETIKKIEHNRGAAKKDILLKLSEYLNKNENKVKIENEIYLIIDSFNISADHYLVIEAKREHRIKGKKLLLEHEGRIVDAEVLLFPFIDDLPEVIGQNLFEEGVALFTQDKDDEAREYLTLASFFASKNEELIEALGALEGRMGNYESAIAFMDRLEKINPSSVMAPANRSLFYMKLGDIEKAEEEKAKATLKSFEKSPNQVDDEKIRKDSIRRLGMYEQVLEIDPDDEMANQGSAQINFDLQNYDKSYKSVQKLLAINENNLKALSLMAKILVYNKEVIAANEVIDKAILIAGKKGDFLLANEMQSLSNSLKEESSF